MSGVELTQLTKLSEKEQQQQHYENPVFTRDVNIKVDIDNVYTDIVDCLKPNAQPDLEVGIEEHSAKEKEPNGCKRCVIYIQTGCYNCIKENKRIIKDLTFIALVAAYFVYFGYAIYHRFGDEGSHRLLGFTIFAVILIVGKFFINMYRVKVNTVLDCVGSAIRSKRLTRLRTFARWFLKVGVIIFLVVYIVLDVAIEHPRNLISVAGLALYIIIFYLTSTNPAKVNWHPVFWGIILQCIFALAILRTQLGYDTFKWLGDRVTELLEHTMAGVLFAFGDMWFQHFFAFKVLSMVVFVSTFINILYFLGVMHFLIRHIGRFLSFCMDTSPAESLNAVGNIFVSMDEAPLLIQPFLTDMTKSELHAVMTGGFATIAGSVMGAYIGFGVPVNHLISASVMSAPAALAISKLTYPETEKVSASSGDFSRMEKPQERNLIEAASAGATASIKLVGSIAVNVIAFLCLLDFVNATLIWFGERIGLQEFSFQFICSYILYPVAYFMGTAPEDSRKVAELVGIKTFTNEFIAFGALRDLINNRHKLENYTDYFNGTGSWSWRGDNIVLSITNETLKGGIILVKSEVIATYALCGFSNFGSIGITLGGIGALVPNRKQELSSMVLRAMIAGNVACFMTACIASLLYKEF